MSWKDEFNKLCQNNNFTNLVKYIIEMKKLNDIQSGTIMEKDNIIKEKENIIKEKDNIIKGKNEIIKKKEDELNKIGKYKDQSQKYENEKAEEFYDVIIKINSIQNLAEGWDISMSEKGKENYENFSKQPIIRIGVIGNENKGKTTILKKLSDFDLPTGYSIKTEGLSIKYPQLKEYPNLKIVLLDSAGSETPVLNHKINDTNNKNSELDFIEKARDKLLTEVFLQNYIIKNSDLLLLVFGKLTYEKKKLLEKVKRDMKYLKRREPLIVIHNLKEFERGIQVENYIKEILLNCSTFNLVSSTEINKDKEEKKWNFYYEPNSTPKVFHLIFAKEGTEAGDYYNEDSIKYILTKTYDITDRKPFDIINSIKNTFYSVSESILEEPLKKEEEDIIEDNKKIKLNNTEKQIKLKKCLIDEIGFSNFLTNGFEPKYEYYVLDDKFIINLEMPGEYKNTKIKKVNEGSYIFLNISGTKINNNEDNKEKLEQKENSFNNREYGEFHINIKIEKINLDSNKPEVKKDKGITSFIYQIKKEEEETEF